VPVVRFEQFIGQNDPLFGWPVGQPLGYITALGQPLVGANSFPRELFPQFPQSLRTQIAQDATRLESRLYYETLEFYKAPLDHLVHYSVGGGLTWDCVSKEDESLAQAVSDWLEEWGKRNRLWRLVPESVLNLLRDGETFTRTWDADEYPEATETEASWIRGPHNEIYGPWAMGCLCPQWPKRFDKITAFNLWYPDNTQEQLAPTILTHTKLGASNVKRGIPLSYCIRVRLPQIAELMTNMASGEAARQKIAYVRQFALADEQAIRGLAFNQGGEYDSGASKYPYPGHEEENAEGGADVPLISEGQEYKEPPTGGTSGASGVLTAKTLSEAIAAALGVPVWFVLASADMENYSSSLVSESPGVQTIQYYQRFVCEHFEQVGRSALTVAIVNGLFPVNTLDVVKVHCNLPSPVARNRKDEVATDLTLLAQKLKAPQQVCASDGLDFDEVTELLEEAEAAGWEDQTMALAEASAAQGGQQGPASTGNASKE